MFGGHQGHQKGRRNLRGLQIQSGFDLCAKVFMKHLLCVHTVNFIIVHFLNDNFTFKLS